MFPTGSIAYRPLPGVSLDVDPGTADPQPSGDFADRTVRMARRTAASVKGLVM